MSLKIDSLYIEFRRADRRPAKARQQACLSKMLARGRRRGPHLLQPVGDITRGGTNTERRRGFAEGLGAFAIFLLGSILL